MRRPLLPFFLLLASVPALAQSQSALPASVVSATESQHGREGWTAISAETTGQGSNVINAQVGYPGFIGSYYHGVNEGFDIGARFGLLYDSEQYVPPVGGAAFGIEAQALFRFLIARSGNVRFGLEIEPGIISFFPNGGGSFGIQVPIRLTIAAPVARQVWVHGGFDLPLVFNFVPGFVTQIPLLFGGGVEYLVTRDISLNLKLRFGPSIQAVPAGATVALGMDVLAGAAFRL